MPEEKISATKYKNDFQKEKYDRIIVNVPKGQRDVIKDKATQLGYKSLNSFVVEAINEKLEKKSNIEIKPIMKGFIFFVFISLVQDNQKLH